MRAFHCFILGSALVLLFPACGKKPQVEEKPTATLANLETARLGMAIDAYVVSPTDAQAANAERAFAELDGEIAELDLRITKTSGADREEARTKSVQLHTYRDKEMARFTEAQIRAAKSKSGASLESAADKIGDGVKEAVESVKDKLP